MKLEEKIRKSLAVKVATFVLAGGLAFGAFCFSTGCGGNEEKTPVKELLSNGSSCIVNQECQSGFCLDICTPDDDEDGYPCSEDEYTGNDCDDTDPDVYPDAPEIYDSKDNQCPSDIGYGGIDEGYSKDYNNDGVTCADVSGLWHEEYRSGLQPHVLVSLQDTPIEVIQNNCEITAKRAGFEAHGTVDDNNIVFTEPELKDCSGVIEETENKKLIYFTCFAGTENEFLIVWKIE